MIDDVWREFFDSFAPQYMNEVFTGDSVREAALLTDVLEVPAGASKLDARAWGCRKVDLNETEIMVVMRRPPA